MKELMMKARSGVTLVELLVVILIVTILSVSLLPLLKPYIEQAKYAAEVQPTLANIQTKINLYQYEKDRLPSTVTTTGDNNALEETYQDNIGYTWALNQTDTQGAARVYEKAQITGFRTGTETVTGASSGGDVTKHLSADIDVDWQDLMGRRINPSQCKYHVIKGLGASCYGYVLGVFGDGEGIAKGTGYAILVLVDTNDSAKLKLVATWERYKPVDDNVVTFKVGMSEVGDDPDRYCYIPESTDLSIDGTVKNASEYQALLVLLKKAGWSFNSEDYATEDN